MDITKTRIHYVYGLHYPDGKLFYVGKGKGRRMYDHAPAARAKIRTARANQVSPMKGRKHSKATKEKISQAKTGVPSGRKGIPRTDGHIKVINDKWRGSKQTPEALALISAASKARWQDPVYVEKVLAARAAARSMKKMEASCQ